MKNGVNKLNKKLDLNRIQDLNSRYENSHPDVILSQAYKEFGQDIVLGTGFGPSGVLLIHRLSLQKIPIRIFYLDTHLLFRETYRLHDELQDRFNIEIEQIGADLSLNRQAEKYGDELWKSDPDRCCYLRKVLPLKTYLSDKSAWVTGVRRGQTTTRNQTRVFEWDPLNEVVKINPLADWKSDDVWEYINKHNLPFNPLHDQGYTSIGCIPCTEPADSGIERSGRWKNRNKIECGIHLPSQNFQNGNHK